MKLSLKDLIRGLRRLAPDRTRCRGCSCEDFCEIILQATARLERLRTATVKIQRRHDQALGAEKAILAEVLSMLTEVEK